MKKHHALWLAGLLAALVACLVAQRTGYHVTSPPSPCDGIGPCIPEAASRRYWVAAVWALLAASLALFVLGDVVQVRSLLPVEHPHQVPAVGFLALLMAGGAWAVVLVGGSVFLSYVFTGQVGLSLALVLLQAMALLVGQVLGSSPRRARAQGLAHLGMLLLLPFLWLSWRLSWWPEEQTANSLLLVLAVWPVLVALVTDRLLCRMPPREPGTC